MHPCSMVCEIIIIVNKQQVAKEEFKSRPHIGNLLCIFSSSFYVLYHFIIINIIIIIIITIMYKNFGQTNL